MSVQLDGQTDLLELLEVADANHLNEPYYECVCGTRLQCDAPTADVAHYSIKHRAHVEAFTLAQWPDTKATLTTKAPHPINLGMRYTCPCCLANWGELKPEVLERHRAKHEEVEPGICRHMLWIRQRVIDLQEGRDWGHLAWTDEGKTEHLDNVTRNRDGIWTHYNERRTNGVVQSR